MELAGIGAGLVLAAGAVAVLVGLVLHAWVARHPNLPGDVVRWAARLTAWLGHRAGPRWARLAGGLGADQIVLALTLALGLAAVVLAGLGVGVLVDNVTEGDGVATLDHPVARFVDAHRSAALTSVMKAVSVVGGPAGMTVVALAAGLVLGVRWRSRMPAVFLAVTAAGVLGLTAAFKAALGRARPSHALAVATAPGHSFPSGHAAAAAAVCGALAWLCSLRIRSWWGRIAVWAGGAMLAVLVGFSRVYLGVHWVTDVLGGWLFGILWLAVVVSSWAVFGELKQARSKPGPEV